MPSSATRSVLRYQNSSGTGTLTLDGVLVQNKQGRDRGGLGVVVGYLNH
jgi:hypothetical protein